MRILVDCKEAFEKKIERLESQMGSGLMSLHSRHLRL